MHNTQDLFVQPVSTFYNYKSVHPSVLRPEVVFSVLNCL